MSGFVTIERAILSNPKLRGKDDIYAAVWLICQAAWKPVRVRVGREMFDLERGQCAFAVRYLAEAWECGKSSAHARLTYFEKIGFCRTEARTGATVITLCNYDKYQQSPDDARTRDRTEAGQCPDSARTKKKEDKPVEQDSGDVGGGAHARDASPNPEIPTGTDPAPKPTGTDPTGEEARTVATHFHTLREEGWPTEVNFPAPMLTLQTQAATVLACLPLATVLEVMTAESHRARAVGMKAPNSLKAYTHAFDRAIRAQGGTHELAHPTGQHPARGSGAARGRSQPGSVVAATRDLLAAAETRGGR
ncbi:MAG: hypothetical protein DI607_03425 [Sphingomonas hengshuiensis]|nr:MAG: hypothetical protein DI607_03425 [Sphingomonas hengshuiensis]